MQQMSSFWENVQLRVAPHTEECVRNWVVLNPRFLDVIALSDLPGPYIARITTTTSTHTETVARILDFTAPEGWGTIPDRLLALPAEEQQHQPVTASVSILNPDTLPIATRMTVRCLSDALSATTTDIIILELEEILHHAVCISSGTIISLPATKVTLEVVEVTGMINGIPTVTPTVMLMESEIPIDFVTPPPPLPPPPPPVRNSTAPTPTRTGPFVPFSGTGRRLTD